MATLMVNSLIVSGGVVVGTVILSSLGGFALGRLRLRGTGVLPLLLTIGLVLPFEVLMIPLFYSFRAVGLLDSYLSMILPQVALGLPVRDPASGGPSSPSCRRTSSMRRRSTARACGTSTATWRCPWRVRPSWRSPCSS